MKLLAICIMLALVRPAAGATIERKTTPNKECSQLLKQRGKEKYRQYAWNVLTEKLWMKCKI